MWRLDKMISALIKRRHGRMIRAMQKVNKRRDKPALISRLAEGRGTVQFETLQECKTVHLQV
jgi:hypothetical protein